MRLVEEQMFTVFVSFQHCHKVTVCYARFSCTVRGCGLVFENAQKLSEHKRVHDQSVFVCDECGYSTTSVSFSCPRSYTLVERISIPRSPNFCATRPPTPQSAPSPAQYPVVRPRSRTNTAFTLTSQCTWNANTNAICARRNSDFTPRSRTTWPRT
jgi:hypothetical protein